MLNKSNFFKNFSISSKKLNQNIKKTKKIFNTLKDELNDFEVEPLQSYEKDYNLDFTEDMVKKFSNYKNIIIIGMGGSILGTKSIYNFFKKKIKKRMFFFDNLDENLYKDFNKIKNLKNSCFIVVSKSGNTLETITNLGIIFSETLFKNKIVFITEAKDNALVEIANKLNADIIEHKNYIVGRYAVLSEVGMFPAALLGLNIDSFKNLKNLIKNKNFVSCLIQNVASIYSLSSKGIKNSVILNYDSDLYDLGFWYQQLVSESLGKKGKGITPILSYIPKDNHSTLQLYLDGPRDKFFTFFNSSKKNVSKKISKKIIPNNMKFLKNKQLSSIINAQHRATKNIYNLRKIPFREITLKKNDEIELGTIFTFFVLETILLARLMNINPFDQPAVEQVKVETKKILLR